MLPDFQRLEETYRGLSDGEILRLAAALEDLTPEAQRALTNELARRSLREKELAPYRQEQQKIASDRERPPSPTLARVIRAIFGQVGYYIFEAFRDIARGKK